MRTQILGAVWDSVLYKGVKIFLYNVFKWNNIKTILALLYYESKYTSYMWQLFYYVQPYIAYRFSWPLILQGWNQAILDRLEPELVPRTKKYLGDVFQIKLKQILSICFVNFIKLLFFLAWWSSTKLQRTNTSAK